MSNSNTTFSCIPLINTKTQQVVQTTTVKDLEIAGFLLDDKNKSHRQSIDNTTKTSTSLMMASAMEHPDIFTQTRLLFDRELKKLVRDKFSFVVRVVSNLVFGLLFGLIFKDVGRSDYVAYPEVMASFGAQSNLLISTMFGVAQSSLMEFPKDRPVFLREYSTNHYSVVPYFLSKFTIECFTVLIQVLSQLIAAFFLMGFRTNFFAFMALNFALAMASTSIGIFIGSCVQDPSVAAELMPALIVPQLLFSGFFIQTNLIPDFLVWAQYLCSLVYATRLANSYEFGDCDTESCRSLLENNEVYQLEQYWYWIILLGIAAVFRIAATVILKGKANF